MQYVSLRSIEFIIVDFIICFSGYCDLIIISYMLACNLSTSISSSCVNFFPMNFPHYLDGKVSNWEYYEECSSVHKSEREGEGEGRGRGRGGFPAMCSFLLKAIFIISRLLDIITIF